MNNFPQPQQQSNGAIYVFIGVIFLILCGMVVYIILNGKVGDYRDDNAPTEDVFYHITIKAIDESGHAVYGVNYIVKDTQSNIIEEGILEKGVLEKFSSKDENGTYILEVEGDNIYKNSIMCYTNKSICVVNVIIVGKISMDIAQFSDHDYIMIDVTEGTIRQPILCLDWQNLNGVVIEGVQSIQVPSFYKNQGLFEVCYRFSEDLKPGLYQEKVHIEKSSIIINDDENIWYSITLIDICENSYKEGCLQDKVVKVSKRVII